MTMSLSSLWMDARVSVRRLRRQPGVAAAVVLPVALAIAATTALDSVVDGLLFRPLPLDDARSLVAVDVPNPRLIVPAVTPAAATLPARLANSSMFAGLAQSADDFKVLGDPHDLFAANLSVTGISPGFFETMGMHAAVGRLFSDDDFKRASAWTAGTTEPAPVILSDDVWRRLFGGDSTIVGRTLSLADALHPVRVVGIMPKDQRFPGHTNVWTPAARRNQAPFPPSFARLAPGATIAQARATFPEFSFTPLRDAVTPEGARAMAFLLAAAATLLLLSWVQVASLLLASATSRVTEIGTRLALGASRSMLVRQFAVGGLLLTGVALALGWLAVPSLTRVLIAVLPVDLTAGQPLTPDLRVFLFACAASALGLLVLCVMPAIVIRWTSPLQLLRGSFGDLRLSAARLRHGLLVLQIALTTVLLYVAGLTAHSYARAATLDYGFDAENVLVFRPNLGLSGSTPQALLDQFQQLQRRLLDSADDLRSSPLVTAAGAFGAAPFADQVATARGAMSNEPRTFQDIVELDGHPIDRMRVRVDNVDWDFIRTLGATLEAGRPFDRQGDRTSVIVNETAARQLRSPLLGTALDRTIRIDNFRGRVIGVVKDFVDTRPDVAPEPQIFTVRAEGFAGGVLIVRVKPPMEVALPAIRGILERRWGRLAPTRVRPMVDDLDEVLTPWRARSIVLNLIAAFCLPLAVIGVAGALTYAVRARTREHAIRLALGAEPVRVRRSIVRQAMMLVAAGLGIGLFGGMAAGRVMASVLFDVHPFDLLTIAAVIVGVCVLTWLAAMGPARRAASVAPAEALREA